MRIFEKHELRSGTPTETDELSSLGQVFLAGNQNNFPTCWTWEPLDLQAIISILGSPTLLVTGMMIVWREKMKRFSMYNESSQAFATQGHRSHSFDRPDLIARICNQNAHAIMKDLPSSSEELSGLKSIGVAAKLELHGRNNPQWHIFLSVEVELLETFRVRYTLMRA